MTNVKSKMTNGKSLSLHPTPSCSKQRLALRAARPEVIRQLSQRSIQMALIQFTANFDDLSTDRGFQFRFRCDKCGNGYQSRFQPFTAGIVSDVLRTAGNIFGGVLGGAGQGAYEVQRAIGGKAHDEAFAIAVEEAKPHFHQCTRCGKWVCP